MTIPTQRNCPHAYDGWCLTCVGKLVAELDDAERRARNAFFSLSPEEKVPPVTKADVVPGTIIRHRNGRHFYIAGTDVTLDLAGNDKVDIDVHFYRLDGKAPMMVPVNPVRTTNIRKFLEPGQYTVIAKNALASLPRDPTLIRRYRKAITSVDELHTGDVVETPEKGQWLILGMEENGVTGVLIVRRQRIGERGMSIAERADTMLRENSWSVVGELVEFPKQP